MEQNITKKPSLCNEVNHEPSPQQTNPTTTTNNIILEANHPRPGTFTMTKDYVLHTETIFPPGYRPSQTSYNEQDHSFPSTSFGQFPVSTKCTNCLDTVITRVTYQPGRKACILAGILLIVGCCLVPLCVRSCQDVIHWCPKCHEHLATFRRDF